MRCCAASAGASVGAGAAVCLWVKLSGFADFDVSYCLVKGGSVYFGFAIPDRCSGHVESCDVPCVGKHFTSVASMRVMIGAVKVHGFPGVD